MTTKEQEILLKNIKMAMLSSGLNQTTLAKKMNKTQGAINKMLNGGTGLSIKNLEAIAAITKKPLNYFFDQHSDVHIHNSQLGNHNTQSGMLELEVVKQKIKSLEKEMEGFRLALENMQLKLQRNKQKEK